MATYSVIGLAAMPHPTKTPFFTGLSDKPITEFLNDYGELADSHKLTNKQKVETILCYVPHSLRDLWQSLPSFASGNWTVFSAELEKLYPDLDAEMRYSRQGLIDLVNLSARTRMRNEKDVLDYYRRFLAISNPLRAANLISDDERDAGFFRGFHPNDHTSLANWLYPLHPNRPRNKPYSLNDVLSVARVYFADLHLFRPMQHPDDHAQSAYLTRWPHQPLQDDCDTRWYDHEPTPYQRDRNFPHDRNLPCDPVTQLNCDHPHSQPEPPNPGYEARAARFPDTPQKTSTREDKELEEMMLKMHTFTVHDPAYMVLYAQICHHFPNVAKTLLPPDFGQMTTVAYHTPTSHTSSTTTQQLWGQQMQLVPLSDEVAAFFGVDTQTGESPPTIPIQTSGAAALSRDMPPQMALTFEAVQHIDDASNHGDEDGAPRPPEATPPTIPTIAPAPAPAPTPAPASTPFTAPASGMTQ